MITAKWKGFSVLCTYSECRAEFTVLDDINGKLTEEDIQFCAICGERLQN